MKGFGMIKPGETGWIEVDKPSADYFGAIIRPIAVSPCTSDVHTVYECEAMAVTNKVLGHEAVGEIVEVGKGVKDFKPGDKVIVGAGAPNWFSVDSQRGVPSHSDGLMGALRFTTGPDHGVFGEYFYNPQADANLAHLPDDISIESALMIPDMIGTGFLGTKQANVKLGECVLVIGIGPVGLMSVACAKLRGAGRIIGVGNRPVTIEKAKYYGATDVIDYKNEDVVKRVMELTNNQGVDKVVITGGGMSILKTALALTKPGAIISNVNYFPELGDIPIDNLNWGLGMANKEIKGSLCECGRYILEREF